VRLGEEKGTNGCRSPGEKGRFLRVQGLRVQARCLARKVRHHMLPEEEMGRRVVGTLVFTL